MKVIDKLNMTIEELKENGAINIVAFGDSVTHGSVSEYNNYETVYWNLLKKKLNKLCDSIPVNVINSGIGGTTATESLKRIDRDVFAYHPDLVIVCFGLNDVNGEKEDYVEALKKIFRKCKSKGADVIFMTPNMLNTYSDDRTEEQYKEYSKLTAMYQNSGKMDEFIEGGIKAANDECVPVCDCYSKWKWLYESGIDTTQLLANYINHPKEEMHILFSEMLYDIILDEKKDVKNTFIETMFKESDA